MRLSGVRGKGRHVRGWFAVAAVLVFSMILAACTNPGPGLPVIQSFKAAPATLELGQSSILSWTVTGAFSSIELRAGDTPLATKLTAEGQHSVTPTADTEYTLVVTGQSGKAVRKSVTVKVSAPSPHVVGLTLDPVGPVELEVGGTQPVGFVLEVVGGASTVVDWAVSDPAVLAVDSASTSTLTGSVVVEALSVGSAVLTGTTVGVDADGDVVTASVTFNVTVVGVPPTIDALTIGVVAGSQFVATWTASGADTFDVVAVNNIDPADVVAIDGGAGLSGALNTVTLPIPDSSHQSIRLVATNGDGASSRTAGPLQNVVLNALDYDPYHTGTWWYAEDPIDGTLRQIINDAPNGAIIGFAADVVALGEIEIFGVELESWGDAHLYLGRDVTISAPSTGMVLTGRSAFKDGDPGDPYTYRSRMVFVDTSATVVLENLTIRRGDFVFAGGGIRNLGTLTLNNVTVTENRAWYSGGGIFNLGTLEINESRISDNIAGTYQREIGTSYIIRGNPAPEGQTGPISAGGWGGGLFQPPNSQAVTVSDSEFSGNLARRYGGGLYTEEDGGSIEIANSTFGDNVASSPPFGAEITPEGARGGGVLASSSVSFSNVEFSSNDATGYISAGSGGALAVVNIGHADVNGGSISDNTADYGSAAFAWTCTTLEDVLAISGTTTVTGNQSRLDPGNAIAFETEACITGSRGTLAIPGKPTAEQNRQIMGR